VFLITTGSLRTGDQLPSVRELARRLKIHHNTVSEAYQELVRRMWVTRQRGTRLAVGLREIGPKGSHKCEHDSVVHRFAISSPSL
jgi:DNA-binding transcriptional regulator YhcF (GntR family)